MIVVRSKKYHRTVYDDLLAQDLGFWLDRGDHRRVEELLNLDGFSVEMRTFYRRLVETRLLHLFLAGTLEVKK